MSGIAFHWYSGDQFDNVAAVHAKYPKALLLNSEATCRRRGRRPRMGLSGFELLPLWASLDHVNLPRNLDPPDVAQEEEKQEDVYPEKFVDRTGTSDLFAPSGSGRPVRARYEEYRWQNGTTFVDGDWTFGFGSAERARRSSRLVQRHVHSKCFRPHTAEEHSSRYAHDIMGVLNAGGSGWLDWNLILNTTGGPNHVDNVCPPSTPSVGRKI